MKTYKLSYSREEGDKLTFKSVVVSGENLTKVLHDAERSNWVQEGWTLIGVEQAQCEK